VLLHITVQRLIKKGETPTTSLFFTSTRLSSPENAKLELLPSTQGDSSVACPRVFNACGGNTARDGPTAEGLPGKAMKPATEAPESAHPIIGLVPPPAALPCEPSDEAAMGVRKQPLLLFAAGLLVGLAPPPSFGRRHRNKGHEVLGSQVNAT